VTFRFAPNYHEANTDATYSYEPYEPTRIVES
jgi:hypothetical protein